ncbi:hypothetical protein VTK56DRAFT_8980 [Thermocarpiscus australiensis]
MNNYLKPSPPHADWAIHNRVIATGSSFKGVAPLKNLSSTEETKATLHDWSRRIKTAKSIVVAGAGATGIEIAGELGQEYGLTGQKEITLVCDGDLPLSPKFKREVREAAKNQLERLKVKLVTNTRVESSSTSTNSITLVTKKSSSPSDKAGTTTTTTTIRADLLLPTYGVTPNTSYLPPSMLDDRGFVKQTPSLRAEGHDNIFVVGDAGNLEDPQGVHTDRQVVHVVKLLEAHLLGPPATAPDYEPDRRVIVGSSLGRKGGVGQIGNWRVWSFVLWLLKSRYLGTDHAASFVRGDRTATVKNW